MDLLQKIKNKKITLQIFGLLAIAGCFLFPALAPLLPRWFKWSQDLGHSLPTLLFMLFLLWRIIPVDRSRDAKPTFWFLCAALAVSSFAWYLVESINIEIAAVLLSIVILMFYLATSFSAITAIQLFPIIGLLFFVIPIWAELNDVLVKLSSIVVGTLVDEISLTAIIEGNTITLPSGRIMIADGCSGLRYLTISILMGYIISLLNGYNVRQGILALSIAAILGIMTNWIRIFLLVLIGYFTEMQSSLMHDHEMFGWVLFAAIMLPAIYLAPIIRKEIAFNIQVSTCKPLIPTICLLIGPVLLFTSNHSAAPINPLTLNELTISNKIDAIKEPLSIQFPSNTTRTTRYVDINGIDIQIDLAKFTPTTANEKLVPYIESLFNKEEWLVTNPAEEANKLNYFQITQLKNFNTSQRVVMLHQFNIGNSATGSYRFAKILQVKAKLLGESFFGLFTAQANCETDCTEELAALKSVAEDWQQHKSNSK